MEKKIYHVHDDYHLTTATLQASSILIYHF